LATLLSSHGSVDKRPLVKAWKAAAKRIEPPSSWPLVGVPTGESAGFDVLDVDVEASVGSTLNPCR
jgi:hypothetical protein